MERYAGKHQKEPGHQTRDTASPVHNVRSPGDTPETVSRDGFMRQAELSRSDDLVEPNLRADNAQSRLDWPGPHVQSKIVFVR